MYQHIGVPVHLAHVESLGKAINTAADLATLYHSQLTLVAVTGPAPSEVAHNVEVAFEVVESVHVFGFDDAPQKFLILGS